MFSIDGALVCARSEAIGRGQFGELDAHKYSM